LIFIKGIPTFENNNENEAWAVILPEIPFFFLKKHLVFFLNVSFACGHTSTPCPYNLRKGDIDGGDLAVI